MLITRKRPIGAVPFSLGAVFLPISLMVILAAPPLAFTEPGKGPNGDTPGPGPDGWSTCPAGTVAQKTSSSNSIQPYTCVKLGPGGKSVYAQHSNSAISFDYPAGWSVKIRPTMSDGQRCIIDVYLDHTWSEAPHNTSGWAHVELEFVNAQRRYREEAATPGGRADLIPTNLTDYRRAMDCASFRVGKPPLLFSYADCSEYIGTMSLGPTKTFGYVYQWPKMIIKNASRFPEFNAVLRQKTVVFALRKNQSWIYSLTYLAPGRDFDRYWPNVAHLLASLRLTPEGAQRCGRSPQSTTHESQRPESSEESGTPVDPSRATPMLR